jgi:hypothetical protein
VEALTRRLLRGDPPALDDSLSPWAANDLPG